MKALSSNNVLVNGHLQPATVIFSEISGKIVSIVDHEIQTDDLDHPTCKLYHVQHLRNVSPLYILPGLVDSHVHLNEPGRTEWEGFATGTQAAISGGVTTIIDMPLNAIPPTTTLENFQIKLQLAQGQTWCDVGFWGGLVPTNLEHLVPLIELGVRGFKGFLIDSGVDEFPLISPSYIEKAMERVQDHDTLLMFHAEMQPRVSHGPQIVSSCCSSLPSSLPGLPTTSLNHRLVFNIDEATSITPEDTPEDSPTPVQTPPLEADEDVDDIELGMSLSFISRAPAPIPQLLKAAKPHREDHLHCKLPHNHAGSIDHSVLTDEQLILLSRSPNLSALEPKFGHAAELANKNHHYAQDEIRSPILQLLTNNSVLKEVDPTLYLSFLLSRPDVFETTAIAEIVACSVKNPRVPLHIVHLATHELVPLIRALLLKNLPISVETCFHYLSLSLEKIMNGSTQFKCCPPIRTTENMQLLWQLLKEGIIQTVVSDHSPCIPELKSFNSGDFFEAWGGISSIGFGLSILHTEGKKYSVGIEQIVRWCCENTAKQVGLDHRKGVIRAGFDADFAIFDPTMAFTIDNDRTFFKNKFTAYHGKQLTGRVVETVVRGNSVYALGKGVSDLPVGELLLEPRGVRK